MDLDSSHPQGRAPPDPISAPAIVKDPESGGDRRSRRANANQDSSQRDSSAVDSVDSGNPKVSEQCSSHPEIQDAQQKQGLAGDSEDSTCLQKVGHFGAPSSARNAEVQDRDEVRGKDLGVVSGVNVDESVVELDKLPEPYFLRRVLQNEWGETKGDSHRLLAITVHAAMLESGFLGIDPVTRTPLRHIRLSSPWPREASTSSIQYSLPEILAGCNDETCQRVVLRFQTLGDLLVVYGSLTPAKSELRRICLNVTKFSKKIDLMVKFCHAHGITDSNCKPASCRKPELVGFKLWRLVKDGLVLPLMIDLSEKAGSRVPPSFARMPADVKIKIFEHLKGVDLARVGCVSSELQHLSSNGELWKKLYVDEFGEQPMNRTMEVDWKKNFVRTWIKSRRRPRRESRCLHGHNNPHFVAAHVVFQSAFGPVPIFGRPLPEPPRLGGPFICHRCGPNPRRCSNGRCRPHNR